MILDFLTAAIKPITELIDNLTTTDEERGKLANEVTKLQNDFAGKLIEQESKLMELQSTIITAEAKGEGWLQRNWRPIIMLWFAVLLGMFWFGVTPPNLSQETINHLFNLLELGLGGYIVGRSVEKTVKTAATALPSVLEKMKGK